MDWIQEFWLDTLSLLLCVVLLLLTFISYLRRWANSSYSNKLRIIDCGFKSTDLKSSRSIKKKESHNGTSMMMSAMPGNKL